MTEDNDNTARLRIGHLVWIGWMVILIAAAVLLPPLDSRRQPHPAFALFVVVGSGAMQS